MVHIPQKPRSKDRWTASGGQVSWAAQATRFSPFRRRTSILTIREKTALHVVNRGPTYTLDVACLPYALEEQMLTPRMTLAILLVLTLAFTSAGIAQTRKSSASLHKAVETGDLEAVRKLISKGSDVNKVAEGGTPLHLVAGLGRTSIAKVLLTAGADPNKAIAEGIVPLHYAAHCGHLGLAEQLINTKRRLARERLWRRNERSTGHSIGNKNRQVIASLFAACRQSVARVC